MTPSLPRLPGGAVAVPMLIDIGGGPTDINGGFLPVQDPYSPGNPSFVPVTGPTLTVPGGGPIGVGGAGPSGSNTNPGQVTGTVGTGSTFGNVLGFFANPVRWVLLIIGLILIAGAVYLFKPTSEIIAAPARAARDAIAVSAA